MESTPSKDINNNKSDTNPNNNNNNNNHNNDHDDNDNDRNPRVVSKMKEIKNEEVLDFLYK